MLTIPYLQKSLNVLLRWHWARFAKEQAKVDLIVKSAYSQQGMGEHFRGKQVSVLYTLYFERKVRRDLSNYGQKMIDDSLVREGIIDDDNCNVILEETIKIRYDKKNPRTEVLLQII